GARALRSSLRRRRPEPFCLGGGGGEKGGELWLETLWPRAAGAVSPPPPMARASEPEELLETTRRIARSLGLSAAPQLDVVSLGNPEEERLGAPRDAYSAEGDVAAALAAARAQAGASGLVLAARAPLLIRAPEGVR